MTTANKFFLLPAIIAILLFACACSDSIKASDLDGKWVVDLASIADEEMSPQEKMMLQGFLAELELAITFDTKAEKVLINLGDEMDEAKKMVLVSSGGDSFKFTIDGDETDIRFLDKDTIKMSVNGENELTLKRKK